MDAPILNLNGVTKTYPDRDGLLTVLDDVTASVSAGRSVALIGPSGSGKTTLLGLCAGLDLPTSGTVTLAGQALNDLDEEARAALRRRSLGFVFQSYQLIPTLTALENVCIPLELAGEPGATGRAAAWLDQVGLADRMHHYPVQLSGGEQQRVALARACVHEPSILFADEPTGNLDGDTGEQIADLLFKLHCESGTTLVLVTHNPELARRASVQWRLTRGRLTVETP